MNLSNQTTRVLTKPGRGERKPFRTATSVRITAAAKHLTAKRIASAVTATLIRFI